MSRCYDGRVSASGTTDIVRGCVYQKRIQRHPAGSNEYVSCIMNVKKDDSERRKQKTRRWMAPFDEQPPPSLRLMWVALGIGCYVTHHNSALGLPAVALCWAGGGGALNNLHAEVDGGGFIPGAPETRAGLLDRFPFPGLVEKPSLYVDRREAEWGRKDPISPVDSVGVRR